MNVFVDTPSYAPPLQHHMVPGPALILVVDDDDAVRLSLRDLLQRHNYSVEAVASGETALERLDEQPFDLVLLDLKLPGVSGMHVAQHARQIQPEAKVILLTGHGSLESALEGMHLGVFDYLLKTESAPHVLSRIADALAARQEERHKHQLLDTIQVVAHELGAADQPEQRQLTEQQSISVGTLQISPWQQTVRIGDQVVRLTSTELRLLVCLARHAGQAQTYQQIAHWGLNRDATEKEAAELIKPHIYHLRQKIERDPGNPRHIFTVRSVGYLLATSSTSQPILLQEDHGREEGYAE